MQVAVMLPSQRIDMLLSEHTPPRCKYCAPYA